jgi:hypothetical protein
MNDPGDLARLADIVVPPPISWWPLALGWWILAAAIVAALAILALSAVRRYHRNAYRRAALVELQAIGAVTDPASAVAVSAVLKRVALVAYPRSEVASLTGSAWLAFLDRTAATSDFTAGPAADLVTAALGNRVADGDAMLGAARAWVRRHGGLA